MRGKCPSTSPSRDRWAVISKKLGNREDWDIKFEVCTRKKSKGAAGLEIYKRKRLYIC